ncbi:MAG: hypothetical protein BWY95_02151 [Bacteroidetes bacterium ADurb.BinA104]|nr:MAG: hypothetical protein BWY95_02151 [Bacteroidetes bacterium ADurb.BinA104]
MLAIIISINKFVSGAANHCGRTARIYVDGERRRFDLIGYHINSVTRTSYKYFQTYILSNTRGKGNTILTRNIVHIT